MHAALLIAFIARPIIYQNPTCAYDLWNVSAYTEALGMSPVASVRKPLARQLSRRSGVVSPMRPLNAPPVFDKNGLDYLASALGSAPAKTGC